MDRNIENSKKGRELLTKGEHCSSLGGTGSREEGLLVSRRLEVEVEVKHETESSKQLGHKCNRIAEGLELKQNNRSKNEMTAVQQKLFKFLLEGKKKEEENQQMNESDGNDNSAKDSFW